MKPIVIEDLAIVSSDDGGIARIIEVNDGVEDHLFIRIQSWDISREHTAMRPLEHKRLRVTIEVVE